MKAVSRKEPQVTLAELITLKNDQSPKGRWGLLTGNRNWTDIAELYRKIGKSELIRQAAELEQKNLLTVAWKDGRSMIARITFSEEDMDEFYRLAGKEHPKYSLQKQQKQMEEMVRRELEQCRKPWIRKYLEGLLEKVRNAVGKSLPGTVTEEFMACLRGLDHLDEPVYKRIFSAAWLKDSKKFEHRYQKLAIEAAAFCETVSDGMEDTQILEEIGLMEYAAHISLKGPLKLALGGQDLGVEKFRYGISLNTKTMREAEFLSEQPFGRVITIENKANFEAAEYREDTVWVYVHGFPGPEERNFLSRLRKFLETECPGETEYLHSSDLDYGGICIFRYIRERIFPELQPYQMSRKRYEYYRACGYGYTIPEETMKKLEKIQEPLLAELTECLKQEKTGIEQECFLAEPFADEKEEGGILYAGKD